MNNQISLRIFFSFYFKNFSLPHTLTECEECRKSLTEKGKIDLHFGEHWGESPFTRRFLFSSNPHLHYKKNVNENEILKSILQNVLTDNTTLELDISIVQGGSGGAELKIDNLQFAGTNKDNFFKSIRSFQEETVRNGGTKDFSTLFSLNKFFVQEINKFRELLKGVGLEVEWNEFVEENIADYIVAFQKDNDEYKYVGVTPADKSNKDYFYQNPYLVLYCPYLDDRKERVKAINDYFGGMPLFLSKLVFKPQGEGKQVIEETLKEAGVEKLVIKNEKEEDIAEIYIDPTKILVFTKSDEEERKQIEFIIHRALFFGRTIMHYCILWDARLQIIFQKIYDKLLNIESKRNNYQELFNCLDELNEIQLKFAKDEAELYNSFIWRYSSFLPSKLGYLPTIYEIMENLSDIRNKIENLRNSIIDIRSMLEYTSNIIRAFIAPKLPELLKEATQIKN